MTDDFADWVWRSEERQDIACRHRVAGLMALLDKPEPLPEVLPPLGHWMLAPPIVRQSEIDIDGHPCRGGNALLPPIALPRRMWAGSEIVFQSPIAIGAPVVRRTTIAAITPKTGRSGSMLFMTLDHDILSDGVSAILERQHIVYREAASPNVPPRPEVPAPRADAVAIHIADPVSLFRYSALTFNGHRIHYDRDYALIEGDPCLVVHGPLLATLLLDHAQKQRPGASVSRFAFRAQAPVFVGSPISLALQDHQLWIEDAEGMVAMTAEIGWV